MIYLYEVINSFGLVCYHTEIESSFSPFNVLNEDLVIDSKNNIKSSTEDSKKNNESSTENSTSNSVTSTEKVIQNTTSAAEEIVETPVVEKVIETTSTPEEIVEKTNTLK